MKTKVFYLTTRIMVAVVLLAILAVKAFAGETPKLKMVPYSVDKAIISVDNAHNAVSELTIEDVNGDVLYYKEGRIDGGVYSKIFDFKNLDNGAYKITVKNIYGTQTMDFKIDGNKFELIDTDEAFAPYFEVKDNVLRLSFLNYSLDNVSLELTDENGYSFSKELGDDFSITDGFNLSQLFEGEYELVLNSGKKSYSFNFER